MVEWNEETCSRHESRKKKTKTEGAGNEKFRNRKLKGKPHQQNIRDGRENFRHWRQDRINGYLGQRKLKLKKNSRHKTSRKSEIPWKGQIYI